MRRRTDAQMWLEANPFQFPRPPGPRSRAVFVAIALVLQGVLSTSSAFAEAPPLVEGDLYYTRACLPSGDSAPADVRHATFRSDGSQLSIDPPTTLGNVPAAGPMLFSGNGDVLVYGTDGALQTLPMAGTPGTDVVLGSTASQLRLDPSGTNLWATTGNGTLLQVNPSDPTSTAALPINGDDSAVIDLAFTSPTTAYYLASAADGTRNLGAIDMSTSTTTRLISGLPAGHQLQFDSFSQSLLVFGPNRVSQIHLAPATLASVKELPDGGDYGQGTPDGLGHAFLTDTASGDVLVLDYSTTGLVGDASTTTPTLLDPCVSSVAPLAGPGAATFYGIARFDSSPLAAGGASPVANSVVLPAGVTTLGGASSGGSGAGAGGGSGGGGNGGSGGGGGGRSGSDDRDSSVTIAAGNTVSGQIVSSSAGDEDADVEPGHSVTAPGAGKPDREFVSSPLLRSLSIQQSKPSLGPVASDPAAPNSAATPELDSLALFGSGLAGLASFVALRRRASPRRRSLG